MSCCNLINLSFPMSGDIKNNVLADVGVPAGYTHIEIVYLPSTGKVYAPNESHTPPPLTNSKEVSFGAPTGDFELTKTLSQAKLNLLPDESPRVEIDSPTKSLETLKL